jgi:hypothetical protein
MVTTRLPSDFKEFIQLLNTHGVDYLVVGGYAVAFYGYPRATADLNVWVGTTPENARKLVEVLDEFGFGSPDVQEDLFLKDHQSIRMGMPPLRIEILTTISGVEFGNCFGRRRADAFDGVNVSLIAREDLETNKRAAGRPRDLDDLAHMN